MRQLIVPALLLVVAACSKQVEAPAGPGGPPAPGAAAAGPAIIAIDGSSTVFPISEVVAEEFQKKHPGTRVTIGVSGTGGGFKKFCAGEVVVANASRPIKPAEVEACAKGGVEFIELPVAYDGIAVVVSPENTWADAVTVAELKKMWEPAAQGTVKTWSDVRAGWPATELHLFGAGVDSGTYDYFTQAVVGKEHSSRGDFTSSEDDNVLVRGVANDKGGLGFFGISYYEGNRDKLKLLGVDDGDDKNGAGPIKASVATVTDGTYQPLARPIFIYVSKRGAERPEVQAFVKSYLSDGRKLVAETGYVALPDRAYELAQARFDQRTAGSVFGGGGSKVGVTVLQLLGAEG